MNKDHSVNCPNCGASIKSTEDENEVKCPYCGSVVEVPYELGEEELDQLSSAIGDLANTINGRTTPKFLSPHFDDKECENKMLEQLVLTDLVPVDIFNSLTIDGIQRNFFPLYVYDVNWSAEWSATFTKRVSHQEQKYDYRGRPDGTKTVYETLYRDANGTSAGNLTVVLRAFSVSASEITPVIDNFKLSTYRHKEATEQKSICDDGWEVTPVAYDSSEAWEEGRNAAEKQIERDVENKVSRNASERAGDWSVSNTQYTWKYHTCDEHCVQLPVWTARYKYNGVEYGVKVDANDGTAFLGTSFPKNKEEERRLKGLDEQGKEYQSKQVGWYWSFGLFATASVVFFILLLSLGRHEYTWSSVLSVICCIITIISLTKARKWHQKNNNIKNERGTMLFEAKKKRKDVAKKKYNIDVKIGDLPKQNNVSKSIGLIINTILIVVAIISICVFFKHHNAIQEEEWYFAKIEQSINAAEQRAVGTYYFTENQNVYRIVINEDNTTDACTIDSYDKDRGYHRNNERKHQSGTWHIGDHSKNMDIQITLDGYGLSLKDFCITDGVAYRDSYSSNEIGKVISEAQFNRAKELAESRYTNKVWEEVETIGYDGDERYTSRLELSSNGYATFAGRLNKSIEGWDRYYDMPKYEHKNVEVTGQGKWEVVLISPEYGQTSDLSDSKYWGVLLSIDKDVDIPEWIRKMNDVDDNSYSHQSNKRRYLITDNSSVPIGQ